MSPLDWLINKTTFKNLLQNTKILPNEWVVSQTGSRFSRSWDHNKSDGKVMEFCIHDSVRTLVQQFWEPWDQYSSTKIVPQPRSQALSSHGGREMKEAGNEVWFLPQPHAYTYIRAHTLYVRWSSSRVCFHVLYTLMQAATMRIKIVAARAHTIAT